jgi:Uma2 family endonuclease
MSLKLLLRDTEILPPYLLRKPGVSEEEYFEITDEDSFCELFHGELIMHSPASRRHEELFGFLLSLFKIYTERKKLGTVLGSRFAMRLGKDLILEPDIVFIEKKREKNIKDTYLEGPCDLVVEILSKTTKNYDLNEKRRVYRDYAIPEIWLVDPDTRTLIVEVLSGSSGSSSRIKREEVGFTESARPTTRTFRRTIYKTKNIKKGIFTSVALKGFSLRVSWLWEEPLPLVTECIEKI